MKLVLALLAFLVSAFPVSAATLHCAGQTLTDNSAAVRTVCTKNFYFAGTCSGTDANPALNDGVAINTPYVQGWEPVSISIEDVWIIFMPPQPATFYAFAGNGYMPDIMTWLSSDGGQRHLPSGTQMQFPAMNSGPHMDLHVWCLPVGTAYQGYYTVVYTPNPT